MWWTRTETQQLISSQIQKWCMDSLISSSSCMPKLTTYLPALLLTQNTSNNPLEEPSQDYQWLILFSVPVRLHNALEPFPPKWTVLVLLQWTNPAVWFLSISQGLESSHSFASPLWTSASWLVCSNIEALLPRTEFRSLEKSVFPNHPKNNLRT